MIVEYDDRDENFSTNLANSFSSLLSLSLKEFHCHAIYPRIAYEFLSAKNRLGKTDLKFIYQGF